MHDIEAKYYADGEDAYDMRKYLRKKGNRVTAPPPRIEQLLDANKHSRELKDGTDSTEGKAAAAEGKEEKDGERAAGGEEEKDKKKKKKKGKGKGGRDERSESGSAGRGAVEEKPAELVKQDIGAAIAALQLQTKKSKQKS